MTLRQTTVNGQMAGNGCIWFPWECCGLGGSSFLEAPFWSGFFKGSPKETRRPGSASESPGAVEPPACSFAAPKEVDGRHGCVGCLLLRALSFVLVVLKGTKKEKTPLLFFVFCFFFPPGGSLKQITHKYRGWRKSGRTTK